MDPSASSPSPLRSTGWDFPEEIIHTIMLCFELRHEDEYNTQAISRRAKRALIAPSLVNKYWSTAIRPLLFRSLSLRDREDALFLVNIVRSPVFATSILATAIVEIHVYYYTPWRARQWLYHIHWLAHQLRQTSFLWYAEDASDATAPPLVQLNPFAVLPHVPSCFLRITCLDLNNVMFTSCRKLVKLVDSLSTVRVCQFRGLSFVDQSPYEPPRWRRRPSARTLIFCRLSATQGMTLFAQAELASAILRAPGRLRLSTEAWRAVLDALVRLVPDSWKQVSLGLCDRTCAHFGRIQVGFTEAEPITDKDTALATIYVRQSDTRSTEELCLSYIWKLILGALLPGLHVAGPSALDALHSEDVSASLSCMDELVIITRPGRKDDHDAAKKIICAVLRRTQLAWALQSRRLRFQLDIDDEWCDMIESANILSMTAEQNVDSTVLVLDVAERADLLLHFPQRERPTYLRQLLARRAAVSAPVGDTAQVVEAGIAPLDGDGSVTKHTCERK